MKNAKSTAKAKREAVAKMFGIPVDPEDTDFINFLYQRRDLATVGERGHRELKYVVELQELEMVICQTLDRIYERDGERFWLESGKYLRKAVTASMQTPPTRRQMELLIAA